MNNSIAENIKERMSLREPLKQALDVMVEVTDCLSLRKVPSSEEQAKAFLKEELAKVKSKYMSCVNFERDFPSIAFSIATGVGKTRLMGACIAYLHLKYGIRNFFVLAPNLTIYNKLIEDFGNPAYAKYLFNGIAEFTYNQPIVITGDNYNQARSLFSDSGIHINVFNVAKFNSETRGTKQGGIAIAPRIKRLSEYLGQSYWEYLSNLDDLVILMDEAHRYHADSSKKAINELRPILGLEMTATPIDEKGLPFKNVVYQYSLAEAVTEAKYVKNPTIATRSNFNASNYSDDEVERIKLLDAVTLHEKTKTELEVYSLTTGKKRVKPFILVVCVDINHAKRTVEYLESDSFERGEYRGKVLRIDSTNKEEEIESQFISLESAENKIEIVVHVNMLKEGWDVTNLYTIVPLRAAKASVLIEQTIGRGLRLPYDGQRTGVAAIDKLTVVSHDNFDKVIKEAQNPDSILNRISFEVLDEEEFDTPTIAITTPTVTVQKLEEEYKAATKIEDTTKRQEAEDIVEIKRATIEVLESFGNSVGVHRMTDLINKPEIKQVFEEKVIETFRRNNPGHLFIEEMIDGIKPTIEQTVQKQVLSVIEIPRITIFRGESSARFQFFNLDTSVGFSFQPLNAEIIRVSLTNQEQDVIKAKTAVCDIDPLKTLIMELMEYPEIDIDDCMGLVFHLIMGALDAVRSNLSNPDALNQVIFDNRKVIAERIYSQMMHHITVEYGDYESMDVCPFTRIEPWSGAMLRSDGERHYREIITPTSMIPKYVFSGFEKAGHSLYKFHSKAEQDLSYVLERDNTVQKWLRPAPTQFNIIWGNDGRHYVPDFIVETTDKIYMIEVKSAADLTDSDVIEKRIAAEKYCTEASAYTHSIGGKAWKYILIPHNVIERTYNFDFMVMSNS